MTYFKMPLDWDEMTEELTLEEKGRLICAIAAFAKGKEYVLCGNEKYVFAYFKMFIEKDIALRESSASSRRDNGKKGGRPRKTEDNRTKPNKTELNREEKEGEKEKAKENEKKVAKKKIKKKKKKESQKKKHT